MMESQWTDVGIRKNLGTANKSRLGTIHDVEASHGYLPLHLSVAKLCIGLAGGLA